MLLVYWLYVATITWIYGVFFQYLLSLFFKFRTPVRIHFAYTMLAGFVFITILITWFSIFYRLNIECNLLLLLGAILICSIQKYQFLDHLQAFRKTLKETSIILKISFGLCLFISSSGSCIDSLWNYDHGMYYVQYVKWVENYAVVPGLGNVIGQLAYNSTWHLLTAVFSFSFLGNDLKFNDLNGLLWLFMMLRSLYGLHQMQRKNARFSDFFAVFMLTPTYITRYYFNAAYTDFTIICLLFLILTLVIELAESECWGQVNLGTLLVGIFSFYAVTVKLSSVPIMIPTVALMAIFLIKKQFLSIGKAGFVILLFVIPWLIRYYYLSGFLVFPFHQIDLFHPDWKMPLDMSSYFQSEIEARSKINQFDYQIHEVIQFSYFRWIPEWFDLLKYYDKFILIFFGSTWSIFSGIYLFNLYRNKFFQTYFLVWLTIMAGLIFWFFKAPSPRFGYAWIFSGLFLIGAFGTQFIRPKIKNLHHIYLIIIVLLSTKISYDSLNELYLFAGTSYEYGENQVHSHHKKTAHTEVLQIIFGKTPKTISLPMMPYQVGKFTFYYPKYRDSYFRNLCMDAPIPCFSHQINYLEPRGDSLQDGFRRK